MFSLPPLFTRRAIAAPPPSPPPKKCNSNHTEIRNRLLQDEAPVCLRRPYYLSFSHPMAAGMEEGVSVSDVKSTLICSLGLAV